MRFINKTKVIVSLRVLSLIAGLSIFWGQTLWASGSGLLLHYTDLVSALYQNNEMSVKSGDLQDYLEKIKTLLRNGVDPNVQSSDGVSPVQKLFKDGVRNNVFEYSSDQAVDPNGFSLQWDTDWKKFNRFSRIKGLKLLLKYGAFDQELVHALSQFVDYQEFVRLSKTLNPSSKNFFVVNECGNKRISKYIRLDKRDDQVVYRFKKVNGGYENLHSQYRRWTNYFLSEEECQKVHAALVLALIENRTKKVPLGQDNFWTYWETGARDLPAEDFKGKIHWNW